MDTNISTGSTDMVLHGIPAIAKHIGASVRRTQWLHESKKIPTFKLGKIVCLRPAAWRQHVDKLEHEAVEA